MLQGTLALYTFASETVHESWIINVVFTKYASTSVRGSS